MKITLWVAFGTLLAAVSGAQARQNARTPDPADPSIAVPAAVHASAMSGYTPAMQHGASPGASPPDKSWRAANDGVGGQGAHAGHEPQAPAPATGPAAAPRAGGFAAVPGGHHQHHRGEAKQ